MMIDNPVEFRITDESPPQLEINFTFGLNAVRVEWGPEAAREVRDRINDYLQIVEEFAAAQELLDTLHSTA